MNTTSSAGGPQRYEDLPPEKQIQTLRIIVAALAMGALMFGVIVVAVLGPAEAGNSGFLTKFGLLFGLLALASHRFVGSRVLAANKRNLPDDEDAARRKLMAARQTATIVSCAIVEAATFFNLIAYAFLDGDRISLAMAGLLWLAMLLHFPLPGALEGWMDRELRAAREERDLGAGA